MQTRSRFAPTLAFACLLLVALEAEPAHAFGFDDVAARAEQQAKRPYKSVSRSPPAELQALTYDQYRDIRFRPARALWRPENLPFEVMFFHLGKFQMESGAHQRSHAERRVRHIRYNSADFDYGKNKLSPQAWGDVGFAGFRAHFPLNNNQYKDEVVVFLGASYFRALGAGQRYGLSARGLALDTVGGKGEEFPRFSEFWVVRPAANARSFTLYALLESPRASGAYQFEIRPGDEIGDRGACAPLPSPRYRNSRHRSAHQHVLLR